jgi:hypothetical protein
LITELFLFIAAVTLWGYLVFSFFYRRVSFIEFLYPALVFGYLIFFLLILCGVPLTAMRFLLIGSIVLTLPWMVWRLLKTGRKIASMKVVPSALRVFLLISVSVSVFKPVYHGIIFEPINHWDAKCIWYFHAKQIYEENALNSNSGFSLQNDYNRNAHPYYPKLVSATAAYLSKAYGVWNEYLPKSNLLVLLIGFLFMILSATGVPVIVRMFFPFLFLGFNTFWFRTGYVDPWLGMYVGILVVFLISYIGGRKPSDFLSCILTGLLILNFKNESIIALVSLSGAGLIIWWVLYRKDRITTHSRYLLYRNWFLFLVAAMPFIVWSIEKWIWHLPPLVGFDASRFFDLAYVKEKLFSDRLPITYNGYIKAFPYGRMILLSFATLVVSLLYFFFRRNDYYKKAFLAAHLIPFLAFFIFAGFFVLSMVITITIDDIRWYVATGADRIYSSFFMLSALPALSLIYATGSSRIAGAVFPPLQKRIVNLAAGMGCIILTAYFIKVTFEENTQPELVYTTTLKFKSIAPGKPGSYAEESRGIATLHAGDAVTIEVTPESEITESMNAHIILTEPSDWQNKLVFHNHIQGMFRITLSNNVAKQMLGPLLTYRNWQDSLNIPPIRLVVKVYRKPKVD